MAIKKLRIRNVTGINTPVKKILDPGEKFGNITILSGRYMFLDADPKALPPPFDQWEVEGFISVQDATTGDEYSAPIGGEITRSALNPFSEVKGEDEDELFGDPDIGEAVDAVLPGNLKLGTTPGSHSPDIQQGARVSFGLETKNQSTDTSPIPGDRPRSVDNSDQFTVRAPSANR